MVFYIEAIGLELTETPHGLRLKALDDTFPLPGQSIEETKDIITKNFEVVEEKYSKLSSGSIPAAEIHEICLRIVLYYFYLYNSWKYEHENEKNRDLGFLEKDFNHPYTYDRIIQFFKQRYPNDYAEKCAAMLDMTSNQVLKYEADRRDFYESFR